MQTYKIVGMTCGACVNKVKTSLERVEHVDAAQVQLDFPQAKLKTSESISLKTLQDAIGDYDILPIDTIEQAPIESIPAKNFTTYSPLILIISFITGVSVLAQFPFENFSWLMWMRHFMAGFFLTFSFFKLLNIEGFASSYQMYDIVATKWKSWGFIYPFVELILGIFYLINVVPFLTNLATFIILGVSSVGVFQSVFNKREIKCACLGDVFNLPMSTVTIVEDLTMVAMAGTMLLLL